MLLEHFFWGQGPCGLFAGYPIKNSMPFQLTKQGAQRMTDREVKERGGFFASKYKHKKTFYHRRIAKLLGSLQHIVLQKEENLEPPCLEIKAVFPNSLVLKGILISLKTRFMLCICLSACFLVHPTNIQRVNCNQNIAKAITNCLRGNLSVYMAELPFRLCHSSLHLGKRILLFQL